jgi:ribose transport system substrate-binding protein
VRSAGRSQSVALAAVAVCLALAAAGCGDASTNTRNTAGLDSNTQMALILPDSTSENWDTLRAAAAAEGQDQDVDVNADAADTSTNIAAQAARVTALAAQQPNCMAIAPIDPAKLLPSLAPVSKKGVPILNVGMQLDQNAANKAGVKIASVIGPQDQEVGYLAARKMLGSVPTGSQVGEIVGKENNPDDIQQRTGIERAVADSADVKLTLVKSKATEDNYDNAQAVVTDLLASNPGIRGLFTTNDVVGLAAVKAVKEAGLSGKVTIVSVGGSQDALKAVQAGTLAATVATYPAVVGSVVVRACQRLITGRTLQPTLTTPARLIDKADVDAELASFPQPSVTLQDPLS